MILSTGMQSRKACILFPFVLPFRSNVNLLSKFKCARRGTFRGETSTAGLQASNVSLKRQQEILLYNAGLWHLSCSPSFTHRRTHTTAHSTADTWSWEPWLSRSRWLRVYWMDDNTPLSHYLWGRATGPNICSLPGCNICCWHEAPRSNAEFSSCPCSLCDCKGIWNHLCNFWRLVTERQRGSSSGFVSLQWSSAFLIQINFYPNREREKKLSEVLAFSEFSLIWFI